MSDPLSVLAAYPVVGQPKAVHYLGGAGGFSGAQFWRIDATCGQFCLRRWPAEYPKAVDLDFIHSVLLHVAKNGFTVAAVPIENSAGATYMAHSGYLWEVAPWMPGRADFADQPTEARLAAAMDCLARFHRAAEKFCWAKVETEESITAVGQVCNLSEKDAILSHYPTFDSAPVLSPGRPACPAVNPSPGIRKRAEVLRDWLSGRSRELEDTTDRGANWPEMRHRAKRLLRLLPKWAPSVAEELAHFGKSSVPLQPCIRDVWHDHLLFQENKVSGLIDFGSMGVDNVSCDIARLLGSLAGGSPVFWQLGLEAYAKIRGLSAVELELVRAFDRSSLLLGALNWVAWTMLDRRIFEKPKAVLQRMDALMDRLETESPFPSEGRLLL